MDRIDQIRAFVATAQTGSFTAAADHLGISNRLTSKYVAELEARMGVRLFQRTTRKVGLTPAGEELLARAPAILDDFDELLADVSEGSKGFSGTIRISAPVTFGEVYVGNMLGRFAVLNPALKIDLRLSDGYTDLAAEGIDLALRIGKTDTLSMKTRKLGDLRSVLVASPHYLAVHGIPQKPEDLTHHSCILDTNRRIARRWAFHRDGKSCPVNIEGRFQVNSARAAVSLAASGLGIAYAPEFALVEELAAGKVVPILAAFEGEAVSVNAVYLEGRTLPKKVRSLIDFAVEDFRSVGVL